MGGGGERRNNKMEKYRKEKIHKIIGAQINTLRSNKPLNTSLIEYNTYNIKNKK